MASQFDVQAFVEADDLSVGKLQLLSKDELHEVAKYVHVEVYRSARKAKLVDILAENLNYRNGCNLLIAKLSLPKLSWKKKGSGLSLKKKKENLNYESLNSNINSKFKNWNWVQRKAKRKVQFTLI